MFFTSNENVGQARVSQTPEAEYPHGEDKQPIMSALLDQQLSPAWPKGRPKNRIVGLRDTGFEG